MFSRKTSKNIKIGELGEDLACEYLVRKGYVVVARNYRETYGEIDIVSKAPDKTLVFVEVKTVVGLPGGVTAEDQMNSGKLGKTRKIAEAYANAHPELILEKKGWRIDLVAITAPIGEVEYNSLTKLLKDCKISHYENV